MICHTHTHALTLTTVATTRRSRFSGGGPSVLDSRHTYCPDRTHGTVLLRDKELIRIFTASLSHLGHLWALIGLIDKVNLSTCAQPDIKGVAPGSQAKAHLIPLIVFFEMHPLFHHINSNTLFLINLIPRIHFTVSHLSTYRKEKNDKKRGTSNLSVK